MIPSLISKINSYWLYGIPIFLLIFMICGIYFKIYTYLALIIFAFIGSILYILIVKKNGDAGGFEPLNAEYDLDRPLAYLMNSAFLILVSCGTISLRYGFYEKNIYFYLSISLCGILILYDIFRVSNSIRAAVFVLIKIMILGLLLGWSNQFVFLGIGGADSYYHIYNLLMPLLHEGHVPVTNGVYSYFPGHVLLVSSASIVSSIDPFVVYYYLGGAVGTICGIFAFLLGYKYINVQFGLLAAFFSQTCDFLLFWRSHPFQPSYALIFAVIITYIALILFITRNKVGYYLALFLVILALIFSHHHTAIIVFMLVVLIYLIYIGEKLLLHNGHDSLNKLVFIPIIFFMLLACQWIYFSEIFGKFITIVDDYTDSISNFHVSNNLSFDALPLDTIFLNTLGLSMFSFFAMLGAMVFIKDQSFIKRYFLLLSVIFFGAIGIGMASKAEFLMPQRLFTFAQQFGLIFLAASGVLFIMNNLRGSNIAIKIGKLILTLGIAFFVFFSSTSTISGFESSLFIQDQPYLKLYDTPQETCAENWAISFIQEDTVIYKSLSYYSYIHPFANIPQPLKNSEKMPMNIDGSINTSAFSLNSFIMFSRFDLDPGFVTTLASGKFGQTNYQKFDNCNNVLFAYSDVLYDNDIVSILEPKRER
jgi:hypothetical protein